MSMLKKITDLVNNKAPLGAIRSSHWARVRADFAAANPSCAVCGSIKKIEIHHVVPFHLDASRELDPTNLITLCESRGFLNCHLLFGHLGNYKKVNLDCVEDAKIWKLKLTKKD